LVVWGWADAISLICLLYEHAVTVSVRINSDRLDAHFLAGLDDTARDLSAISNEDFGKHKNPIFRPFSRVLTLFLALLMGFNQKTRFFD